MDLSELKILEQKQALHELAEAIRRGAKMRPASSGRLLEDGHTCALGAAADGAGCQVKYSALHDTFPILSQEFPHVFEAEDVRGGTDLERAIYTRNDWSQYGPMTREQIADWLDTL